MKTRLLLFLWACILPLGLNAAQSSVVTKNTVGATVSFNNAKWYYWDYSGGELMSNSSSQTCITTITITTPIDSYIYFQCNSQTSKIVDGVEVIINLDGNKIARGASTLTGVNFNNNWNHINHAISAGTHTLELKSTGTSSNNIIGYFRDLRITEYQITKTGDCGAGGSNVKYELTKDGTLKLTGSGAIKDYDSSGAPWRYEGVNNIEMSNSINRIGNYAFYACSKLIDLEIPTNITSIGQHAFYFCSGLESASIPSSVTEIGECAFQSCYKLSSLKINAKVTTISECCFSDCGKLSSILLPATLKSIGDSAFSGCSALVNISMPTTLTEIGDGAFSACSSVKNIIIPSYCNIIGNGAFSGCKSLSSVIIPDNVTSLGYSAFAGCESLQTVSIPSSLTKLDATLFQDCKSLQSVVIPGTIESVGQAAFSNCISLEQVVLCEGVQQLGAIAFNGCTALTHIEIPQSMTNLSSGLRGCTALTDIIVNWTSPITIQYNTFSAETFANGRVHSRVESAVSSLKSKMYWKDFKHIDYYKQIESISIPSSFNVQVGNSEQIPFEITPSDACFSDLKWTSSNVKIVSVSNEGIVSGLRVGTAVLTATTRDDSNISHICNVDVSAPDNSMYAKKIKARAGRTILLPIYMSNDVTIANTQCDLYLPNGMSVKFDEDEEAYLINKGERLKTAHSISCKKQTDGAFRIMITSLSNAAIKDTDKSQPVMYVPVEVGTDIALGSYDVALKNIIIAHYDSETASTTPYTTDGMYSMIILPRYYNVTVGCNDNSFGSVNVESNTYDSNEHVAEAGDELKLTAIPNADYRFAYWTVNGTKQTANPLTLTTNASKNIQAVFEDNTYIVTFMVDGTTYSSTKQLAGHALQTPTVNPTKTGYMFKGWEGLTAETVVPTNDVTYKALFSINQYMVTFVAEGNKVYSQKQDYQSPIVIPTAPAKDKYVFITWGVVDETVPAHDVTYTAEYALLGDVYEDHLVNVADLTSLVDIILTSADETSGRLLKISDIYTDNQINVADYTSLVSLILNPASQANAKAHDGGSYSKPKLNACYTNNSISIDIENASNMTALQFDMTLPHGYSASDIVPVSGFGNHTVYSRINEDGTVRVVICSSMNDAIGKQNNIIVGLLHENANAVNVDEILITNIIGATCNSCIYMEDVCVGVNDEATALNGVYSNDNLSLQVSNGTVYISSSKEQTIIVFNSNGILVNMFVLGNGETRTIALPNGVYVINGKKLIVK